MSIENFVHRYSDQDSLSQKSIQWRLKGLFEASGLQGTRESNMAANSSSGPRIQPVHGKLTATVTKQERENTMRKVLLSMALAVVAPFAWGQVSETTTSTTTTEGNGTITEYTPGNAS